MVAVIAHQGGWDEALILAVPAVVYILLLLRDRFRRERDEEAQPEAGDQAS